MSTSEIETFTDSASDLVGRFSDKRDLARIYDHFRFCCAVNLSRGVRWNGIEMSNDCGITATMMFPSKRRGFETLTLGLWLSIVISCCVIALQFLIQTHQSATQNQSHKSLRQVQSDINKMHLSSQRGSRYWRIDAAGRNCQTVGVDFGGSLQGLSDLVLRPPCPSLAKRRSSPHPSKIQ